MAGKSDRDRSTPREQKAVDGDRLEYVADLLLELRSIATDAGCETLAGLLSLSHAEAMRKANGTTK